MKKFTYPSNNRLCVHFPTLIPSVSQQDIDCYLSQKRYEKIEVDIISLANAQLGKRYCRGVCHTVQNQSFDCSGLMQWLYGQKGMYIPRISIDQRDFGTIVNQKDILAGDLVFTTGSINYYWEDDKENQVGHVGIYTGSSVIHAANKIRGVVEDPLDHFLGHNFRGIVRMHNHIINATTLIIPQEENIEYDVHLMWRILQTF
jgi:hypothetical protein